ncbi:NAC domain protein [Tripterygium wilfordii]|uniref:NAC domain protein n=1 Tax=Tripterygium wilfordii TaxID=458696 RepID=A0A7J7E0L4_TRIWF|nr:NAC domain protein [Tripterygium wilfordii]
MEAKALPPGFRFHPTDEELIIHYLQNQATSRPCLVSNISEVDIYKFDPWDLPGSTKPNKQHGSMRLDDWVLCRIYKKRHAGKVLHQKPERELYSQSHVDNTGGGVSDDTNEQQQMMKFPRTSSLSHMLELDYMGPISQLLSDNPYTIPNFDFQSTMAYARTDHRSGFINQPISEFK